MAPTDDDRRRLGEQLKHQVRQDIPLEYIVMSKDELRRLDAQGELPAEVRFALLGEHDSFGDSK